MNPFKVRLATGCFALVVESCVLPDLQEGTLPTPPGERPRRQVYLRRRRHDDGRRGSR